MMKLIYSKSRKCEKQHQHCLHGVTINIETHFAAVYEKLYNSIDDKEKLMTVLQHLNTKIDSGSFIEVEKITPALIKEAISKLKMIRPILCIILIRTA